MHDRSKGTIARAHRALRERIRTAVDRPLSPVRAEARHLRGEPEEFGAATAGSFEPVMPGDRWGPPWRTTWLRLTADTPDDVADLTLVIDIGYDNDQSGGFVAEGMIFDETGRALQGLHPKRSTLDLSGTDPGSAKTWYVEAAANPPIAFDHRPTVLGRLRTAGDAPLYRFAGAWLARRDPTIWSLALDVEFLLELVNGLDDHDPRRARIVNALDAAMNALDALPVAHSAPAAAAALVPVLRPRASASAHRLIAVGHAHIDHAWLWPMRETVRKCHRTFTSAEAMMEREPGFVFCASQAAQYQMVADIDADLFSRIRDRVEAGQWFPVGGQWVEADANLPSGESLIRQFVHGQRAFESWFGRRSDIAWIPDVFGYPASLPQIFRLGGCHRFVTQKMSWSQPNRFPHHTFNWTGIDGSKVLAHFPPVDTYNAELRPSELLHAQRNFAESAWSRWSLVPYGHGDGGGGPTPEMLHRARRGADLEGIPRIQLGSPHDFFEAVEAEISAGAEPPEVVGELYLETHRGTYTSQLRTKEANRRAERLLRELELVAALASPDPALGEQLDRWWKQVLTHQFHDILPGSSIGWVHDETEAALARVAHEVDEAVEGLLDELAPTDVSVLNVRTCDADEVVIVDARLDGLESQALADGRHAVHVAARALGVGPAAPESRPQPTQPVTADERVMANQHLDIAQDAGEIVSAVDRDHDRELLAGPISLELAPDIPASYDAWDLDPWTRDGGRRIAPTGVRLRDSGPLVGQWESSYEFGESSATLAYRLCRGSRRLVVEIDVVWAEREQLLSLVVPLDVHANDASCGIQFGHIRRPTHRSLSWDAAKFEVCAHRFVDLSEPSFGVAVLDDGRYGHAFDGSTVRVSLIRGARYPDPDADLGRHRVRIGILPHGGAMADVVREAEAMWHPLRVHSSPGSGAGGRVALRGRGVEVDAVKPADDGSGDVIIRCHEALGDRAVLWVDDIERAWIVPITEERGPELPIVDGSLTTTLKPFEICTLRISP